MSSGLTSRQRVERTLNHQQPDRVPLSMTITEVPYTRLRKYLGLAPDKTTQPNRFGEVNPAFDLLESLGFDTTSIKLSSPEINISLPTEADGTVFDEWGVGRKQIDLGRGAFLLEVSHSPFDNKNPKDIDLDQYPWPDPADPGRVSDLAVRARTIYHETELALIGRFGGTIMEQASFLRGYETWLMDLVLYPDFATELMNKIADIQIALDQAGIRTAGKYLSIFKASGDDLGMQDRPMFSQDIWQNILRPILRRRWRAARQALDTADAQHVKIMFHSDGAIRSYIPDLIDDGIQVLDPIQTRSTGMEIKSLKREFGKDLVFHGGIDTQFCLPFGTEGEVEKETIRVVNGLGASGGLIIGPVHNVQPDVPAENIAAMSRTVQVNGVYPLG